MSGNELKKLSRSDLLEMLLELRKENAYLKQQLERAREQMASKELEVANAGSLAEAALRLNGVFEAAQKACDQYTENVRLRIDRQEREITEKCARLLAEAKEEARSYAWMNNMLNEEG